MKPQGSVDPTAAFPDRSDQPTDADLKARLGRASAPLDQLFAAVQDAYPHATHAWQYSNQAGWYRVALLRQRRLFYLVPKRDSFRLSIILGGKAIAALQDGPYANEITRMLKSAKRYPEGTAFDFVPTTLAPALVAAMVDAKLAH